jgi:hypothetical protein
MEIAQTIVHQIIATDPTAFLRYKAFMFLVIPESQHFEGGLKFTDIGKFLQGYVSIYLT